MRRAPSHSSPSRYSFSSLRGEVSPQKTHEASLFNSYSYSFLISYSYILFFIIKGLLPAPGESRYERDNSVEKALQDRGNRDKV